MDGGTYIFPKRVSFSQYLSSKINKPLDSYILFLCRICRDMLSSNYNWFALFSLSVVISTPAGWPISASDPRFVKSSEIKRNQENHHTSTFFAVPQEMIPPHHSFALINH